MANPHWTEFCDYCKGYLQFDECFCAPELKEHPDFKGKKEDRRWKVIQMHDADEGNPPEPKATSEQIKEWDKKPPKVDPSDQVEPGNPQR